MFGIGAAVMQVVQAGTEAQVAEATRVLAETRRALYRVLAGDDEPPAGDGRLRRTETGRRQRRAVRLLTRSPHDRDGGRG